MATKTLINDMYRMEMMMRAHHFSNANEKGRNRFNIGHVFDGVVTPRVGELLDLVAEENSRGIH